MPIGAYGGTDVPKEVIRAMELVYQASTFRGVIGDSIPTEEIDQLQAKFDVEKGVPGEYNIAPDAELSNKKFATTQLTADMVWTRYNFMMTDGARLYARDGMQKWDRAIRSGVEYFNTVKDYQVLAALSAGAASSAAASGGVWTGDAAKIEADILTGLSYIETNSNVQDGENITLVAPINVKSELMKLDLIGNVQQQLGDYFEKSFSINIKYYRPYKNNAGTAILDGLGNDAILYVNGPMTARHFKFSMSAAMAKNFLLTEKFREPGRGDGYYMRMAMCARVTWDAVNATNTKSNRIYKITSVKS